MRGWRQAAPLLSPRSSAMCCAHGKGTLWAEAGKHTNVVICLSMCGCTWMRLLRMLVFLTVQILVSDTATAIRLRLSCPTASSALTGMRAGLNLFKYISKAACSFVPAFVCLYNFVFF